MLCAVRTNLFYFTEDFCKSPKVFTEAFCIITELFCLQCTFRGYYLPCCPPPQQVSFRILLNSDYKCGIERNRSCLILCFCPAGIYQHLHIVQLCKLIRNDICITIFIQLFSILYSYSFTNIIFPCIYRKYSVLLRPN